MFGFLGAGLNITRRQGQTFHNKKQEIRLCTSVIKLKAILSFPEAAVL